MTTAISFLAFATLGAFAAALYYLLRFSLASFWQQGGAAFRFAVEALRQSKGGKLETWAKHALIVGVAVCLLVLASQAFAAPTDIFDQVSLGYKSAAATWYRPLHGFAKRLFALLAVIEIAWAATLYLLEKNDYQSFVSAIAKKIMGIGFFLALLTYADTWIPSIINSFAMAGQHASGSGGLSPSNIITRGLDCAWKIFDSVSFLGLDIAEAVGVGLVCLILACIIALVFAVVACQLLVALVESYIAISAGVLFLGFGGSRWTTDFVQKYIGYSMACGVKLLVMYLLIGAGMQLSSGWADMLNAAAGNNAILHSSLSVLIGAMLLAFLAYQIPSMAASLLAGSPSLTAGGAGAVVGGMVAGGIAGAATGAAGLSKLAQATRTAWGSNTSAPGAPGGAVSTLGSAANLASSNSGPASIASATRQVAPPTGAATATPQAAEKASAVPATPSTTPTGHATPPAPPAPVNSIGAASSGSGANTAPSAGNSSTGPGLVDRLRQIKPPMLPNDSAPSSTVHILLDGGRE